MRNKSVNKVFSKYNIDMILRLRAAFVIIFLGCEISAQDADWCEDIDWSHNEFDSSKINIFLYTRFVQLSTLSTCKDTCTQDVFQQEPTFPPDDRADGGVPAGVPLQPRGPDHHRGPRLEQVRL